MDTTHCNKCGKEILANKKKCEFCKKSTSETWKKVGKGTLSIAALVGTTFLTVITKNKVK